MMWLLQNVNIPLARVINTLVTTVMYRPYLVPVLTDTNLI